MSSGSSTLSGPIGKATTDPTGATGATGAKASKKKLPYQLGKLLTGKLNSSKLPDVISIFDVEFFNLTTCYKADKTSNVCDTNAPSPSPTVTPNEKPTGPTGNLSLASTYLGKNISPTGTSSESYSYKTRKEFEKLYLGELTKEQKKVMIKLFRFMFTKQPVAAFDSDSTYLLEQLPAFYKAPCKGEGPQGVLWELFKQCITFRIHGSGKGGLNGEIGGLQQILPEDNQEFKNKQYLRAQLLRLLQVLDEDATCITFSDKGGVLSLTRHHTAILDLIKRTVISLMQGSPITEEDQSKQLDILLNEIKNLTENTEDPNVLFNDMLSVVRAQFKSLDSADKGITVLEQKLREYDAALDLLTGTAVAKGKIAAVTKGGTRVQSGGADVDDEEYDRVFTSAMEHLHGMKSGRDELLASIHEILDTKGDIEEAIEQAVYRKGFSLSSAVKRLNDLEGSARAKSFIRCIQTLLEIKEAQLNSFEAPTLPPGEARYLKTLETYPFLRSYTEPLLSLSKTAFALEKKGKTLRHIYPYTEALMEDIELIREKEDPCCLFYKAMLAKQPKARKLCAKAADIPQCKKIIEDVLAKLNAIPSVEGLQFTPIELPKTFWLIADVIRPLKVDGLPITVHRPLPEFEEVLGDTDFVLSGKGTVLKGIKNLEIDVKEEMDELRKGEISIGAILFLYLYINCNQHIDA